MEGGSEELAEDSKVTVLGSSHLNAISGRPLRETTCSTISCLYILLHLLARPLLLHRATPKGAPASSLPIHGEGDKSIMAVSWCLRKILGPFLQLLPSFHGFPTIAHPLVLFLQGYSVHLYSSLSASLENLSSNKCR